VLGARLAFESHRVRAFWGKIPRIYNNNSVEEKRKIPHRVEQERHATFACRCPHVRATFPAAGSHAKQLYVYAYAWLAL